MACDVRLEKFEGPLDLLLHLIKKNEMDIYDIPVAEITAQYLAFIDEMKSLNLDIAGEYLVMAATLLHIKSRLLLPQPEEEQLEEEELDPRAELVRRLLEYQRYKDAARSFSALPQLERDIFARQVAPAEPAEDAHVELEPIGIFELVEAFRDLLRTAPPDLVHEVTQERLSVTERVTLILESLQGRPSVLFDDLFDERPMRGELVVTFLALLELVKMRLVKVFQNRRCGAIMLMPAALDDSNELILHEVEIGYA